MNENIVATEAVLADVLQNLISQLQSPLPAGVNKIGKVDVDNLNDYTTLLNEIKNGLSNIGTSNVDETLHIFTKTLPLGSTAISDISYTVEMSEICLLSNDSEYNIELQIIDEMTASKRFILKAGEKIEGLKCSINSFVLTLSGNDLPEGASAPIRMIYKTKQVPAS